MSSPSPVTGTTTPPATTAPTRVRHEHDHDHGHEHGRGIRRQLMSATAEALGMERKELRSALRDGQTLAQIAESKGTTIDALKTKITESVTASASPEMATKILARLDDFVAGKRIDSGNHHGRDHHHDNRAGGIGDALKTFADSLGMTPQAVVDALKTGKSIRDLIAEKPADTPPAALPPTQPGEIVDAAA
jgi:hypothetical protein